MRAFIVKKSKRGGKGVFANRPFRKGEMLFKCRGKLYTRNEFNRQSKWIREHSGQIGANLWMGPAYDIEDYVNHSCNPNSGHRVRGKRTSLIAIKDIRKGDEIAFDYSTLMYKTKEAMRCKCGSKNCRKTIKDFDKLPKSTQQKYITVGIVPSYIVRKVLLSW